MNKQQIYSYVCEIEADLKDLIQNNRFSELIVSEIINESIIEVHEIDNSSMSDEETARGIVALNIESFYNPKHLLKVEDKYWHWDERLQYGFRGRIMATPDNLMRFRMAVDTTRKEVKEEMNAMLHAVRNASFNSKTKCRKSKCVYVPTAWRLIILACFFIYAFLYAYQHRYMCVGSGAIMDTWEKVLLIPNDKGEYVERK